jgi:hypothetical protein
LEPQDFEARINGLREQLKKAKDEQQQCRDANPLPEP